MITPKEKIDKTVWKKAQLFGRDKILSGPNLGYWKAMNKAAYQIVKNNEEEAYSKKELTKKAHDVMKKTFKFKGASLVQMEGSKRGGQ